MKFYETQILGVGKYNPPKILTNEELCKTLDTSDEWITQRTGIKERRVGFGSDGDFPSGMAAKAARLALEDAKLIPEDIEFIIFSTTIPDMPFPNTASQLQRNLGIENKCACMDINAACTGWLYGITVANALIKMGTYNKIMVVGCEQTSVINNWDDRATCVLFGDGAGVTILGRAADTGSSRIIDSILGCDSSKSDSLMLAAGSAKKPITHEVLNNNEQYMTMDGQTVFKAAVKTMSSHCSILLERNNLTIDDIDWFIPHQANLRIIETTAQLLKFPMDKVIVNVHKYANTSSASIPTAMYEGLQEGKIKRGQKILMAAFGAGLTSGAVLIEF